MRPVPVVLMKPGQKMPASLLGALIGPRVGPLAQGSLYEPLCLAIGAWAVGFGPAVCQPQSEEGKDDEPNRLGTTAAPLVIREVLCTPPPHQLFTLTDQVALITGASVVASDLDAGAAVAVAEAILAGGGRSKTAENTSQL